MLYLTLVPHIFIERTSTVCQVGGKELWLHKWSHGFFLVRTYNLVDDHFKMITLKCNRSGDSLSKKLSYFASLSEVLNYLVYMKDHTYPPTHTQGNSLGVRFIYFSISLNQKKIQRIFLSWPPILLQEKLFQVCNQTLPH